jgi:hypothetical protein
LQKIPFLADRLDAKCFGRWEVASLVLLWQACFLAMVSAVRVCRGLNEFRIKPYRREWDTFQEKLKASFS